MDDEDKSLFREHIDGVKPLRQDKVVSRPAPPGPRARFREAAEREVLYESLHGPLQPDEMETGEELLYRQSGFSDRAFRKLRTGAYVVQAEMDMHGLNSREARQALDEFFQECARERVSCVRIVHGKGKGSGNLGPVLKPKLARWLRQREVVLAYCSALPTDGGTGAVYVLLQFNG